jgi:uncharacterized membrane protein YgcG
MKNKRLVKKVVSAQQAAPLPRWRWLIYAGTAGIIFTVIFMKIGGEIPYPIASLAAWRASDEWAHVAISAVFTGLVVALIKILVDQVLLGIVQRKSKLLIAQELGTFVAQVAVGVAVEGLMTAAASAGSSSDAAPGGVSSGGGGDFGGGGASGEY